MRLSHSDCAGGLKTAIYKAIKNYIVHMRKSLITAGAGVALFLLASTALAASSLFGGATVSGGTVTLVSSPTVPFSGISFDDATGQTVSSLSTLGTSYNATDDALGGGSPRFQIGVDTNGDSVRDCNVFVYIGTHPNFNDAAAGWQSTGNLLSSPDMRFDLSQCGGAFYSTYAQMVALVGDDTITGISLVVDGGWSQGDGEQTILVDNVSVDGNTYTFSTKDDCKNGGWEAMGFRNQGQCVSSFQNQSPNR